MTTKEMIAVMKACDEGKQIQFKGNHEVEWHDCNPPLWDWACFDYRIKPEEEPARMTNRQLAEWCARGFGQFGSKDCNCYYNEFVTNRTREDEPVEKGTLIRPWGSDEWIEPTVDIYERDCKH